MGFRLVPISMTLNNSNALSHLYTFSWACCIWRWTHTISGKTYSRLCRVQRCTDRV